MSIPLDSLAAQMLSSLLVATFGAWLAVQLALRRFRAEKLWEKRAVAYERLIETLHNAKKYSSEHLNAHYEDNEISDDKKAELTKISRESEAEVWKVVDIGSFLLSEEALKLIRAYRAALADTKDIHTWHDHLDHDYGVTDKCLKTIIAEAKRHLAIK